MNTAQLLDQARAWSKLPSDYAVAKRLGVTTQLVSEWRHCRKYPGTLAAFLLADLAGMNPAAVIAGLELDKAERVQKNDALADTWRQRLQRLAGISAAACAVWLSSAPDPAYASMGAVPSKHTSVYIMLTTSER